MNRKTKNLLVAGVICVVAGCSSQGLSRREGGMQNYSGFLDAAASPTPTTMPIEIRFPAKVTLVQVGEITPPESMLSELRGHHELFKKVSVQTGNLPVEEPIVIDYGLHTPPLPLPPPKPPVDHIARLRSLASQTGSDYLLIFGGSIDSGRQGTPLTIFDLTIIGAFIVPSNAVEVSGKAAGSLIDVGSGRVLMTFSADTKGHGMAASTYAENAETLAVETARSELVQKITHDMVAQLTEEAKATH